MHIATDILSAYNTLIKNKSISRDPAQEFIVTKLFHFQQHIYKNIVRNPIKFLNIFSCNNHNQTQGMYIYGKVGRGKSMLMDLFFETCHFRKKKRIHFHAFMIDVHSRLQEIRQQHSHKPNYDPIKIVANILCKDLKLLCFDEFQVHDITDAMLLGRLFKEILKNKVFIIATSNVVPNNLYKNGLQREKFLKFIDLINKKMEVVNLDANQDYRLSHIKSLKSVYFTPLGKKADEFLDNAFRELTNNAKPKPLTISVQGRKLQFEKTYGDILWTSFEKLCEQSLGNNDYIEIAKEFSTLLLSDIPKLSKDERNEAKRFVNLIDNLYEHNVKLICSAATNPTELYKMGDGSFEFQRTVSRLVEMQSERYLKKQHQTA